MNWTQNFFNGFLRESDGTPSSSRLCTLLTVLASLSWVSYVVVKTRVIPDLGGLGMYDTVVIGSLYGVNQLASTAKSFIANIGKSTS